MPYLGFWRMEGMPQFQCSRSSPRSSIPNKMIDIFLNYSLLFFLLWLDRKHVYTHCDSMTLLKRDVSLSMNRNTPPTRWLFWWEENNRIFWEWKEYRKKTQVDVGLHLLCSLFLSVVGNHASGLKIGYLHWGGGCIIWKIISCGGSALRKERYYWVSNCAHVSIFGRFHWLV